MTLHKWDKEFAFTSIKCNTDNERNDIGSNFQLLPVHGAIYHRQGPLVPVGGQDALNSQIYLHDPAYGAQERSRRPSGLDAEIIRSLSLMLQE